jgi:hypothetical protein
MRTLVLLAAAASVLFAQDGEDGAQWQVHVRNGDRVRGRLIGIRSGAVLFRIDRASAMTTLPIGKIDLVPIESASPEADEPARPRREILRLHDGSVLLGRFVGIRDGRVEFRVDTIGVIQLDGNQVAEYIPAEEAIRSYYRSLRRKTVDHGEGLALTRFASLWTRLGARDANVCWTARRDLVAAGTRALPLLRERMRWQPDSPAVIDELIRMLDADDPDLRELAQRRLRELAPQSDEQVAHAAREGLSPETRARAAAILATRSAGERSSPALTRFLRAIAVVAEIGGPEAAALLRDIADGPSAALSTREARVALDRLELEGS